MATDHFQDLSAYTEKWLLLQRDTGNNLNLVIGCLQMKPFKEPTAVNEVSEESLDLLWVLCVCGMCVCGVWSVLRQTVNGSGLDFMLD